MELIQIIEFYVEGNYGLLNNFKLCSIFIVVKNTQRKKKLEATAEVVEAHCNESDTKNQHKQKERSYISKNHKETQRTTK